MTLTESGAPTAAWADEPSRRNTGPARTDGEHDPRRGRGAHPRHHLRAPEQSGRAVRQPVPRGRRGVLRGRRRPSPDLRPPDPGGRRLGSGGVRPGSTRSAGRRTWSPPSIRTARYGCSSPTAPPRVSSTPIRLEADGTWRRLGFDGRRFGWTHLSVHYLPDRPATPCVVGRERSADPAAGPDAALRRQRGTTPSLGDRSRRRRSLPRCQRCSTLACSSTAPSDLRLGGRRDHASHLLGCVGERRTDRCVGRRLPSWSGLWNAPEGLGCVFMRSDGMPGAYSPVDAGNGVTWWLDVAELLTQTSVWQDEHGMLHIFGIGTSADRPAMGGHPPARLGATWPCPTPMW